jgi:hypothetical protein
MEPHCELPATDNYTYQLNNYFGIFYPSDLIQQVLDVCRKHRQFAPLGGDKPEVTINKEVIFASTNSDAGDCTVGFIAADELTFGGPDEDEPESTVLRIEPSEMEKRERKHRAAVETLTDLYEIIIKDFKSRKTPIDRLYFGWQVVSCTWDMNSSSECQVDESDESADKK